MYASYECCKFVLVSITYYKYAVIDYIKLCLIYLDASRIMATLADYINYRIMFSLNTDIWGCWDKHNEYAGWL